MSKVRTESNRVALRPTGQRRHVEQRTGIALIYLAMALVSLTAVCSLAVDFGRWELCKTQMQRAADAAARAGAFRLASNYATAATFATTVANANYVDATTVGSNPNVTLNVQMLLWTSSTSYIVLAPANYYLANACRVTLSYNVPLIFGSVIGVSSKPATRSSTAMIVINIQNIYVSSTGDVWLAGEPTGTQASQPDPNYEGQGVNPLHPWQYDYAGPVGGHMADGQPYSSPTQASITITPGALLTVTNVSGAANYAPGYFNSGNADGVVSGSTAPIFDDTKAGGASEHGIADVYMPGNSLNAVFLGNSTPDGTAAPSVLNFSSQAARDYSSLSPLVKQPFFVGNGQTSGGNQQSIVVPQGATRMFFGIMDCWEWDNNSGGYNATLTEKSVQTVQ